MFGAQVHGTWDDKFFLKKRAAVLLIVPFPILTMETSITTFGSIWASSTLFVTSLSFLQDVCILGDLISFLTSPILPDFSKIPNIFLHVDAIKWHTQNYRRLNVHLIPKRNNSSARD